MTLGALLERIAVALERDAELSAEAAAARRKSDEESRVAHEAQVAWQETVAATQRSMLECQRAIQIKSDEHQRSIEAKTDAHIKRCEEVHRRLLADNREAESDKVGATH